MDGSDTQRQDTTVPEAPVLQDEERAEVQPFETADTDEEESEFGMSILEDMVSRVSPGSSISSMTPPDGGWRAWCVCLSSYLVYMNTWGWVNSFGLFQAYYMDKFSRTASDISWIGSVSVFLLFFVGTLTGRLVDAGYFRPVFIAGILLQVTGVLTTSLGTEYWHLFVTQGVLVGLGHSCIFCPVLAVLSTYFARRRALAMGIAACGSATGRVALDPPLTYTESLDLLMILNGVGIVGRLASSWVADHTGAMNVFAPHALAASVLLHFWMLVRDKPGLYAWAVVYGIVAAAIQSLFPTGVSLLTKDLSKIGVRMGMAFTVVSFAALTGPPIAGAIIDAQGEYYGAQVFAGSVLAMGCGLLIAAKMKVMRRTGLGWTDKT